MLYFRDKKRSPNNGTPPEKQKEPDQFEGGGGKERVAGVGNGAKKIPRLM